MARLACRLLLATAVSTLAVPASADELRDALVQAYHYNPTLLAARSNQRAVDENVPIERAAIGGMRCELPPLSEREFAKPLRV